jgi:hypothetical protein
MTNYLVVKNTSNNQFFKLKIDITTITPHYFTLKEAEESNDFWFKHNVESFNRRYPNLKTLDNVDVYLYLETHYPELFL